ncbi:outer membrane beta-barrel protein [Flavobacterium branchiarum]|uniref:Outer membrane beta-barrel protein n=1 Tax=Flavobacterium branchiarum TaxID=1114870 RepID=A0ABV5FK37_9FLAO|nr:outer membrane beta-barrel protein [Flavobacterium branchiarum]MDN3672402.1 outer membrane beta-barrel protein [Flavobacterium branchiarum]
MKKIILLLVLVSTTSLFAQGDREITYGFFGGGIYSKMSNLPDVIVPKGIFNGYTLKEEGKFGGTAGLVINWKYPYARVSIQTEMSYSGQSTDLNYKDAKGLKYKMTFGYNYLNVGAQFKYYPVEGFYIGAGPYVGFNLTGDNIKYSSNSQEVFGNSGVYFEPDATVQKGLKGALTGKNYFYGMLSAGYEFSSNLSIGARYTLGLTDALTTEENGFRYSENKNKINSFSLVIGYSFNFDDLANF